MILIVTNRRDFTADYVVLELNQRGLEYTRLNTEDFPTIVSLSMFESSSSGTQLELSVQDRLLDLSDVKSVWFRRPVLPQPDPGLRESYSRTLVEKESIEAIEGLWRILDCNWVSRPDAIRRAESKPLQLHLATKLGFCIPDTLVTNDPEQASDFVNSRDDVICKPLRCGQVEVHDTLKLIYTNELSREDKDSIHDVSLAPTLLQERVTKLMDVRVTVIGSRAFSVCIDSQGNPDSAVDWRRGNTTALRHFMHALPTAVERKCIELVEILGLQFGAIDLVVREDGEYVFLEINPNGQWAWLQQKLPQLHLREALVDVLSGADL